MCLRCLRSGGGKSLVLWKGWWLLPSLTDRKAVVEREGVNTPMLGTINVQWEGVWMILSSNCACM